MLPNERRHIPPRCLDRRPGALAAGVAAPALTAPAADAELIDRCAALVAHQRKFKALFAIRNTVEDEQRTEGQLSALYATENALVDQIEDAWPPTTLAGAKAVAAAGLAIWQRDHEDEIICEEPSHWLAATVCEFLTGRAGA